MAEIPANATAFPWRNAIMNIFYLTSWSPGQSSPATISSALTYLTQAQEVLSPYIPYQASCEQKMLPHVAGSNHGNDLLPSQLVRGSGASRVRCAVPLCLICL